MQPYKDANELSLDDALDEIIRLNRLCVERLKLLSKREKIISTLALQELSDNEIAKQLSLHPETIKYFRRQIYAKLKVKSDIGLAKFFIFYSLSLFKM